MDCIQGMKQIDNNSVDMIFCDLPYGTTKCRWDIIIPFEPLWEQYERIIKSNGAIVLFGSEPFTSLLIISNIKNFKYNWYMKKNKPQGFPNAKKMPLKNTETISVFYKRQCTYNPQGLIKIDKTIKNSNSKLYNDSHISAQNGGSMKNKEYLQEYTNYPRQIIDAIPVNFAIHPTQKPIELCKYIIRTYTNEGDLILDNCCGAGSIPLSAKLENRNYIGMDNGICEKKNSKYDGWFWADVATDRIDNYII